MPFIPEVELAAHSLVLTSSVEIRALLAQHDCKTAAGRSAILTAIKSKLDTAFPLPGKSASEADDVVAHLCELLA